MKKALLLVALVGCSKKDGDSDHLKDYKPDEMKAALQGAWVGPDTANLVNKAAYEIKGDDVTKTNAKGETETFKLKLEMPCQFGFAKPDGSTYRMGALVKDGQILWGGGDYGYRKGDYAVMCAGLEAHTVEKGTCYVKSMSGRWKEDAKCGFKQKDGKEVFYWDWAGKEDSAEMDGDMLKVNKAEQATKVADIAAAKAALAEQK
jgi:hypothetical protein